MVASTGACADADGSEELSNWRFSRGIPGVGEYLRIDFNHSHARTYREAILSTGTSTCDESYYDRCGHMACSKSQARSWDRKQTEIRRARHILSAQDRCGHLRLSAGKAESPCMGERTGSEGLQANVQEFWCLPSCSLLSCLPASACLPARPLSKNSRTPPSLPPSLPPSPSDPLTNRPIVDQLDLCLRTPPAL